MIYDLKTFFLNHFNKPGPNRRFLFAATAASRMTLEAEAASRSIGCRFQTDLREISPNFFLLTSGSILCIFKKSISQITA